MTVKEFFKSTAFKCIIVLTSVLLISGVLLAICWGFLEVTDEERFNRKIGAVYGGETVTAIEQDLSGKNTNVSGAVIQKLWYIEEKNDYLVQAASRGNGGNVACWIAVNMQDDKTSVKGIGKVLFYSTDDAAEYVGNIGQSIYDKFPAEYTEGKKFTYGTEIIDSNKNPEFIGTGASYTMTAVCNDVNAAVEFVKAYASGTEAERDYGIYVNGDETTQTVNGTAVEYAITTKTQAAGGLTHGAFKFVITVDKVNGKATITNYEIKENGSSPIFPGNDTDYKTLMSAQALDLKNKTLDDIKVYLADDMQGGVLHTGATNSNLTCYEVAAYALTQYDKVIAEGGNK